MCSPAWDPSGERLALGGGDGIVQAWPVGLKRKAVRSLKDLNGLAWSADSRRILATPNWSLGTGYDHKAMREQLLKWGEALRKAPTVGGMTPPDPKLLLQPPKQGWPGAAGQKPQPQIQVCDAVTGEVVRTLDAKVRPDVLAESPNGQWLATATRDGLIQLWPASGGKQPVTLEEPPKGGLPPGGLPKNPIAPSRCLLSWSPDSKRLACSTPRQTTIHLWDPTRTSKPVLTLRGHEEPARALAWNRDGERIASAHDDGTFKVWDATSGKQITSLPYWVKEDGSRGMAKPLASSTLSWCHDGKRLAVAGEDEAITIWDVDAAKELATLLGNPSSKDIHEVVGAVAWSPDGNRLASASADGKVLLWAEDMAGWKRVLTLSLPPEGPFGRHQDRPGLGGMLAWSPDGKQLAFFGGGNVMIWDATPEENKPGQ
jgi:WD40 repeat protein